MKNIPETDGSCALKGPAYPILTKEIGGTTYEVFISFSKTSTESMNDKILRLIKNATVSR